jgi:hypothetical protein
MVLNGMLSMLGADRNSQDVHALAAQCMKDLDTSRDNKVSKGIYLLILLEITTILTNN